MTLTPAQRRLRAQIAANARWAHDDGHDSGVHAQAGLLARFEREVDPDNILTPAERTRRAENARRVHMQRLAFAASKARQARAADKRNSAGPVGAQERRPGE